MAKINEAWNAASTEMYAAAGDPAAQTDPAAPNGNTSQSDSNVEDVAFEDVK